MLSGVREVHVERPQQNGTCTAVSDCQHYSDPAANIEGEL